tara:strand:- start:289 stop:786 length:498 start_codon:yes stop_codon:yes gene_type:complete
MWTVLKFDKKKLNLLKQDFLKNLGQDCEFYIPKLILQKYSKNKLIQKEFNLLGDYLFCFHKNLDKINTQNQLKFCRGLKYFLNGYNESQNEIDKFIKRCKKMEDNTGYLSANFFKLEFNRDYKFTSGPFVEKIFKIVSLQKKTIDILMGNLKTKIDRRKFLFNPL